MRPDCRFSWCITAVAFYSGAAAALAPGASPTNSGAGPGAVGIPLCSGLVVVTAISQSDGDYESIKSVEVAGQESIRIKYSNERLVQEFLSNAPPKLQKVTMYRTVLAADLATAPLYLQQYHEKLPETVPGTTAIGTSAATLDALRGKGEATLGIFIAFSGQDESIDRNVHPNVYDNQMVATVKRVETSPVLLDVLVNDMPAQLPTIHVRGDFFGDQTELWFLDDPQNPLTLKYRFGVDALSMNDPAAGTASTHARPLTRDREDLQVIKIAHHCAAPPPLHAGPRGKAAAEGSDGGGAAESADVIERSLQDSGKAEVYDIYFSFNSDQIRDESGAELEKIATILERHPQWKLEVQGHTDNIGTAEHNLTLSRSRAAAVKTALVTEFHVDPGRLSADGFGDSRPQDSNATLEGRSHNRRVELIRQQ